MNNIDSLIFVHGVGRPEAHTACIMSAACILSGRASAKEERRDNCAHVCPVVRRFAISVNDWRGWKTDAERTKFLRPIVPILLDTAATPEIEKQRGFIAAECARNIAILTLESRGHNVSKLQELAPIVCKLTAMQAETVLRDAAARAARAARTADHAADHAAAHVAHAAAHAAAHVVSDVAYVVADVVHAADHAARAAASQIRDLLVAALFEMCEVGK